MCVIHTGIHPLTCGVGASHRIVVMQCDTGGLPAFGECVWHASPAMNTRSLTENFDATRWPTGYSRVRLGISRWSHAKQIQTDVNRPPLKRLGVNLVRVKASLCDLQQLFRAHLILVQPPSFRIQNVRIGELDVQTDEVALSWYHHVRAVVGVYGGPITDVGKVGRGNHVDDPPDVLCRTHVQYLTEVESIRLRRTRLFTVHGDVQRFPYP